MSELNDRWMWFIDDAPLQALLRAEAGVPNMDMRAASSPELVHAISLHMEGRNEEALAELTQAAAESNQPGEVYAALGQLLFEAGNLQEASIQFAQHARIEPGSKTADYNLGACLSKLRNWAEAAPAFDRAAAISPERLDCWLGAGISNLHNGNAKAAAGAFEKALELSPGHSVSTYCLAVALHMQGLHERAATLYLAGLENDPQSQEILVNLIALCLATDTPSSVRPFAESLYRINSKSVPALQALAASAFEAGDHGAAERYCTAITETAPNDYEAWFNLGVALQAQRKTAAAAEAYAYAIQINGKSELPYINLGTILQEQGKFDAARENYEHAFELKPSLTAPLWNFALSLEQTGRKPMAATILEELVAQDPSNTEAWFRLGYLRYEAGRYTTAAEAFESALRGSSKWLAAQYNLALCYWKLGDLDLALICIDSALTNGPSDVLAMRAGIAIAVEVPDSLRAAAILQRLEESDSDFIDLSYRTAAALDAAGRPAEAEKVYRRIMHRDPESVAALVNLGHALNAQGQSSEARELWDVAIAIEPQLTFES